jgi:hypothetical protein
MPVIPARLRMHAKAGHHFVEDQYRAVTRAKCAQSLEEALPRHHQVHVAGDRLDDRRGNLAAVRLEGRLDRAEVVVRRDDRELRDPFGHSCRRGLAERQRAGTGLHEKAVAVPVIAAFELHDLRAPRESARKPQRRHGGFGARRDEPHHVERRKPAHESLGELDLDLGWRAERQAVHGGLLHRAHDGGVRVAEDRRPPGTDVIDVALAVRVPHVRAFATREEARRAAYGAKCAHGRVDAARNRALGTREQLLVPAHWTPFGLMKIQSTTRQAPPHA